MPYSSIPVERTFSALKDIKNQKRNRLTCENVEALLLGYQHFHCEKVTVSIDILEEYLQLKDRKKKVLLSKKSLRSQNSGDSISLSAHNPNHNPEKNEVIPQIQEMQIEMNKPQNQSAEVVASVNVQTHLDARYLDPERFYDEELDNSEDSYDYEFECQLVDQVVYASMPGSLKKKAVSPLPDIFAGFAKSKVKRG